MGFLKRHYEKILLGLLLAVFIGLLAFQLLLWQQNQEIQVEKMKGFKDPDPNYTRIDFTSDKSAFRTLAELPNKPFWTKPASRENSETLMDFSDFMKPFPLAICPYCLRVIPAKSFPAGEGAGACLFCNRTLHHPYSVEAENANKDTDGDGIPDQEETKLGLNPNDPTDALVDTDGDVFSNYEEFVSKTNYKDPKSRPPYHEKLYVLQVERPKLPFRVKSIRYKDDKNKTKETATIQMGIDTLYGPTRRLREQLLNLDLTNRRKFSSRAGDYVILDLVVKERKSATGVVEDVSQVVVQKVGQQDKIMMSIGATVYEPHVKAILQINQNNKVYVSFELFEKGKFPVGTEQTGIDQYEVVRIDHDPKKPENSAVMIRSLKDGKEYQIRTVSSLDRHIEELREKARKSRQARRGENRKQ
ncbi:MAG: hypothetical protein IJS14_01845 [Lentisphaeria bacterium]|nr:hypothetical protein [Lentisphaeria bacterium]